MILIRFKSFIFENIYKVFVLLLLVVAIIFGGVIGFGLNNIIRIEPSLYNEANKLLFMIFIFIGIIVLLVAGFIYFLRSNILYFSDKMCNIIDKIISKEEFIDFDTNGETILSKLEHKFRQLVDIMNNDREEALREKDNIKSLISDISHQIKTPIANLSMYNDTLIERDIDKSRQKEFLSNMRFQVSKLEWLIDSLIKMSRLENSIINLNKSSSRLSETIANALGGIYIKADRKNIKLSLDCPSDIILFYDKKWTSEALFNILENSVKYNKINGEIKIFVESFELFTKIDVKDTGIGIDENEINNIFKRFYRSREVSEVEGVGIGLYLSNEIITRQGGYIKVSSEKGRGTTFSIFLKN